MSNSNQNSARQHQSNQQSDRKQLNMKKIVDEFSELDAFGGPNSKIDVRLNNSQKNQINQIIAKLEEIRHKESVYNETIIVDQLMTKEDVILLISKATFIFKQEDVLLEVKAPIKIFLVLINKKTQEKNKKKYNFPQLPKLETLLSQRKEEKLKKTFFFFFF